MDLKSLVSSYMKYFQQSVDGGLNAFCFNFQPQAYSLCIKHPLKKDGCLLCIEPLILCPPGDQLCTSGYYHSCILP